MIYDIQKANMWKRISAFLFDFILVAIAAVGFAYIISSVLSYDNTLGELEAVYDKYETIYGVDFDITADKLNSLTEGEKQRYEEADKALAKDEEASFIYTKLVNLTLIIITFGILLSFMIFEFVIPLLFKNGQTLGKKIFGLAVMRRDGVKISPVLLFTRTVLGKYTVETMLPIFIIIMIFLGIMGIVGTAALLIIAIGNLISIAATKHNTPLHDVISQSIVVDMQSQLIFDSPEELLEYKKKLHREDAEKKEYF